MAAETDFSMEHEGISQALADMSARRESLESFVEGLFDELEILRDQIIEKQREVDAQRCLLEERETQIQQQREQANQVTEIVEAQDANLIRLLAELDQLKAEVISPSADTAGIDEALQAQRQHFEGEHEQLRQKLEPIGGIVSTLSDTRQELSDLKHLISVIPDTNGDAQTEMLQGRLAQLEAERDLLRKQLETTQRLQQPLDGMTQALSETSQEVADLKLIIAEQAGAPAVNVDGLEGIAQTLTETGQEMADLRQLVAEQLVSTLAGSNEADTTRILDLEVQRTQLESELEMVRRRNVEMEQLLNEQRNQQAQQQGEFASELKEMREHLQRQEAMLSERPMATQPAQAVPAVTSAQPAASAPSAPPAAGGGVVDSVMAQFAKLQDDVARRRAHK